MQPAPEPPARPARPRRDLVEEGCRVVGLPSADARHLQSSDNDTWLLPAAGVLVRISFASRSVVQRTMSLVHWLVEHDLPVGPPWGGRGEPVPVADGANATFWRALSRPSEPDYQAFGDALRRLHEVRPPDHLSLPRLDPLARARAVLDRDWPPCVVGPQVARARLAVLAHSGVDGAGSGLVHGDAHIGNMLLDGSRTVIGDWDGACVGTAAWDLLPTAVEPARWGRSARRYDEFVRGYGANVTADPGYEVLRELFEWHLVAERMRLAVRVPRAGRNICLHLSTLASGDRDAAWYGEEAERRAADAARQGRDQVPASRATTGAKERRARPVTTT